MDMMRFVSKSQMKWMDKIQLKIGIHHGECMMGIIGYHKPQFSLIGDAVNFTSRHSTTGKPGHIMISTEAWEMAQIWDMAYTIVRTEMKGKGLIDVYHVDINLNNFRNRFLEAMRKLNRSSKLRRRCTLSDYEIDVLNTLVDRLSFVAAVSETSFNGIIDEAQGHRTAVSNTRQQWLKNSSSTRKSSNEIVTSKGGPQMNCSPGTLNLNTDYDRESPASNFGRSMDINKGISVRLSNKSTHVGA
jgi:hypothetical protein